MIGFPLTHNDISREPLKNDNLKSAIKLVQRDCCRKRSSLNDEQKCLKNHKKALSVKYNLMYLQREAVIPTNSQKIV